MQVLDVYPPYAVGGSCFVTQEYDTSRGQKVISLDVDVANLPAHGMLCVSEEAVRQMCVALGWATDYEGFAKLDALREQSAAQAAEIVALRDALDSVLAAQKVVAQPTVEWVARPVVATTTDEQFAIVDAAPVKKAPAKKAAAKKAAAK
jgi:hypothetical protein